MMKSEYIQVCVILVESGISIARFDSKMKQVSFAKIRDEMCIKSNCVS